MEFPSPSIEDIENGWSIDTDYLRRVQSKTYEIDSEFMIDIEDIETVLLAAHLIEQWNGSFIVITA